MLKLSEQGYRGEQAFKLQKRKHTLGKSKLPGWTNWVVVAPHCGKKSQRQNKTKQKPCLGTRKNSCLLQVNILDYIIYAYTSIVFLSVKEIHIL